MITKIVKKIMFLAFIFLAFLGFSGRVLADDTGIGFTYTIEQSENQINKEVAYFDLMMKPDQEQILKVNITNLGSSEKVIETTLDGAKTNSNGVIEYNQVNIENDESLEINFTELVTTEKEIVLGANETKVLELKVKMPAIEYDGVVAGGLTLQAKESENDQKEEASGSLVKNEYAYVIAILLKENKNDVKQDMSYRKNIRS